MNIPITSTEEFLLALPEEIEDRMEMVFKNTLLHNLGVLEMARQGYVKITGSNKDWLESENTPLGQQWMIEQAVKSWSK